MPQAAASAFVTPTARRQHQAQRGSPWLLLKAAPPLASGRADSWCVAVSVLRCDLLTKGASPRWPCFPSDGRDRAVHGRQEPLRRCCRPMSLPFMPHTQDQPGWRL